MVDRSTAPHFYAPEKIVFPKPEIKQLSNKSRFVSLNIGDQPVVKIEFIFKAGTWYESKPGIAFLTGKMLVEGTQNFSSKQIAEKFEMYGAFVDINTGFDYLNLSIHLPTRHLDNLIDVLQDVLFAPEFPEQELEILRKIQIQQLRVNRQKNNFVAGRLFRSKLFRNQPYGHLISEEILNQVSTEELKEHYNKWMLGRSECFITGNFDDELKNKVFALTNQNLKDINYDYPNLSTEDSHFEIYKEVESSLQSAIFIGKRCINRSDKRFSRLLLLNEVFGGYFGSRLMQNIREEKGYTYGIYSHIVTLKHDAYFVINSEVKKEFKNETLREIEREIEKIKNIHISQEEMMKVKNYLKGSFVNSLTSPFDITDKIKSVYLYDLDLNYYDNLFDIIDDTNEVDIHRLANELLFDEKLSSVVVG